MTKSAQPGAEEKICYNIEIFYEWKKGEWLPHLSLQSSPLQTHSKNNTECEHYVLFRILWRAPWLLVLFFGFTRRERHLKRFKSKFISHFLKCHGLSRRILFDRLILRPGFKLPPTNLDWRKLLSSETIAFAVGKGGIILQAQDRHTQILIYRVAHMLFPYVLAATSISFSLCPFPHRITPFPQTIKSAVRWLGVILTGVWKFTTESLQVNLKSFTPLSFPFLPLWRSKNFKSNDFYRYFTISPYESPVSPHLPCVVGFGQWTWLWQQSLSRGLTQLKWKRSQQHERPKSS